MSVLIDGRHLETPPGLIVVPPDAENGLPARMEDTAPRKRRVTQFVLHRGWSGSYKPGRNFAAKTLATLQHRGLSTTFSMDIDGTVYQHFDPARRRGRHAKYHNVQSDSMDIGGPFVRRRTPAPGQTAATFYASIGRVHDGLAPLDRPRYPVACWSLTPAQESAIALFLPWWCALRGIPVTACSDMRTWRRGGLGRRDPVTHATGILAHGQISGPGKRLDGFLPLLSLLRTGAPISWRENFFQ